MIFPLFVHPSTYFILLQAYVSIYLYSKFIYSYMISIAFNWKLDSHVFNSNPKLTYTHINIHTHMYKHNKGFQSHIIVPMFT